jgi:hypothetical protein
VESGKLLTPKITETLSCRNRETLNFYMNLVNLAQAPELAPFTAICWIWQLAGIGNQLPQLAPNWQNLAESCPQFKKSARNLAESCPQFKIWHQMPQIGRIGRWLPQMAQIGTKWHRLAPNGTDWQDWQNLGLMTVFGWMLAWTWWTSRAVFGWNPET